MFGRFWMKHESSVIVGLVLDSAHDVDLSMYLDEPVVVRADNRNLMLQGVSIVLVLAFIFRLL